MSDNNDAVREALASRVAELEKREQELAARYTAIADEVRAMIQDSDGLAGYHLNGDVACWSEFDVGHLLSEPDEVGGKIIDHLKAQWQAEALENIASRYSVVSRSVLQALAKRCKSGNLPVHHYDDYC